MSSCSHLVQTGLASESIVRMRWRAFITSSELKRAYVYKQAALRVMQEVNLT